MVISGTIALASPNFSVKAWNEGCRSRTWARETSRSCGTISTVSLDVGPLLTRETLRIISFDEIYRAGEPVVPAEVIKKYAAATQEALTDGYRGLRISADVTDLVPRP